MRPAGTGTKAAVDAVWIVAPGANVEVLLAMTAEGGDMDPERLLDEAGALIARRAAETDVFCASLCWPTASRDECLIQRQALAGMLWQDLSEIADDPARRLISLYLPGKNGTRPALGSNSRWRDHPAFRDRLLFYEYFDGEPGLGLGASHQTGWTALLANLIDELHRPVAGAPR